MSGGKRRGVLRGHMARARRALAENLKLVDVVLEVADARLPRSSRHPSLANWVKPRPVVLALTKVDLADPELSRQWLEYYRGRGEAAVMVDARGGAGCEALVSELVDPRIFEGRRRRPQVRAMVAGLPNVGKSSLLNRLAGEKRARTGGVPGVTRGEQWIRVADTLHLLDLPGILTPVLEGDDRAWRLLSTGLIDNSTITYEAAALPLLAYLSSHYPDLLAERYDTRTPGPDSDSNTARVPPDPLDLLEQIAHRRGCVASGGTVDWHRAAQLVIEETRKGVIGRLTLEDPATS